MTKSNAQNLLINRIPSVLYKYVPPKLIKSILQDHTIRCTQPADFSDMFDSTHTADPTGPTLNVFGNQFYFLPVDPVTGLPSQRAKDECVAWVKKSVALYPGFEVRAVLAIPDTPGGNVPTREGFNAHWQLLIPRVICLCESPVGIKMWDHYASGHKGFAIGFRTDCAIFNDQDGSSNLKKVVYSTTGSTGPSEVGLWRKWIIKSEEYAHEMEWRALVFNRFRQIPICGARVIDVADIPEDAIECVVLGQRIGADDEKEIRSCIAPNIKIYRCQADPLSYSLKLIEA